MTTKQPPAQKHLEMAKEILTYLRYSDNLLNPANHGEAGQKNLEAIATALVEAEAAALAARISGPSERELNKHSGMWAISKQRDSAVEDFEMGALWMLANLKLTHESAELVLPQIGLKEYDSKMLENGFDHPCRKTCSGWTQGYDRGRFDFQDAIKKLNTHLKMRVEGE